jgi:2-C-methyl-D-erythritol 4-phosphate cytidylyltransferase
MTGVGDIGDFGDVESYILSEGYVVKKLPVQSRTKSSAMKVSIGGETREISAREFVSACKRQGVVLRLDWYRPVCGHGQAQAILDASSDLRAAVLIEIAARDMELCDALKERIAILWADDLPHSAMDAAMAMTGR